MENDVSFTSKEIELVSTVNILIESKKVTEIMTSPVVTVEMDDSLTVVKHIFDHTSFHHLLVVDADKLLGVISDRDLFKAISHKIGTPAETSNDTASLNKRVHQIMTRNPISLNQDAETTDAIEVFNRENVSCIPIVDETEKPLGIVSWRDILRLLSPDAEESENPLPE